MNTLLRSALVALLVGNASGTLDCSGLRRNQDIVRGQFPAIFASAVLTTTPPATSYLTVFFNTAYIGGATDALTGTMLGCPSSGSSQFPSFVFVSYCGGYPPALSYSCVQDAVTVNACSGTTAPQFYISLPRSGDPTACTITFTLNNGAPFSLTLSNLPVLG